MDEYTRREVIIKLNAILNSYDELSLLANNFNNDINKVVSIISKVIKYAFSNENFLFTYVSLAYVLKSLNNVDEKYKNYINNRPKKFWDFLKRKNKSNVSFPIVLDEDIDVDDLKGLNLPSISQIELICKSNMVKNEEEKVLKQERNNYYRKLMNFEETALEYERMEIVNINDNFNYYFDGLSGNIEEDFNKLYSIDRYQNKVVNPLNNSYSQNMETIKNSYDIILKKRGSLYEIINGRHRILYIIKNHGNIDLLLRVNRRIENKDFNIILKDLKNKYLAKAYKNNLLNDDANIIIIINNKLYEISDVESLKEFYNNLINNLDNNKFFRVSLEETKNLEQHEIISNYKNLIMQKCLDNEDFILNNFTDIINCFDNVDILLLYKAYLLMQNKYLETKLLEEMTENNEVKKNR